VSTIEPYNVRRTLNLFQNNLFVVELHVTKLKGFFLADSLHKRAIKLGWHDKLFIVFVHDLRHFELDSFGFFEVGLFVLVCPFLQQLKHFSVVESKLDVSYATFMSGKSAFL